MLWRGKKAKKLVRKWRGTPWATRRLLLEASLYLLFAYGMVRLVSFRRWARLLGGAQENPSFQPDPALQERAMAVGWAVQVMSRYVPWHATCLMEATAAKLMLNHRKVPSTLYLGLLTNTQEKGLITDAHAWLRCGPHILTGAAGHERFQVVAMFSTPAP